MRALIFAVVSLTVLVAAAPWAGATPSTILTIPSTTMKPKGKMHIDYDMYPTVGQGSDNSVLTDIGLGYGLTEDLEVGFDYLAPTTNPLVFNAKYRVYKDERISIVLGGYNLGSAGPGRLSANQWYGLGSYSCSAGRFAAGYSLGSEQTLGEDHNQLWLSWDKSLTDKWWAGVDFASGKSILGASSVGVAYNFTDTVSMIVGYNMYNNDDLDNTIELNVDIDFD